MYFYGLTVFLVGHIYKCIHKACMYSKQPHLPFQHYSDSDYLHRHEGSKNNQVQFYIGVITVSLHHSLQCIS